MQLIAEGLPTVAISAELGINRATLWRWRQETEFSAEVSRMSEALRDENKERVIRDVAELQELILETLVDVAQNSNQDSERVQASRTLKEFMDRAGSSLRHERMTSWGINCERAEQSLDH